MLRRATIFVSVIGESGEADYRWVREWFARWGNGVRIESECGSSPDWSWDVEAPAEAIAEIPERLSAVSQWALRPYPSVRERKERRHGRR
jgi:hypothetical protein